MSEEEMEPDLEEEIEEESEDESQELSPQAHAQNIEAHQAKVNAAQRLIAIKKSKAFLIEFSKLLMPTAQDPGDPTKSRYDPQKHHRCIAEALEAVERGEILRLIITMPPRAGKSQLCAKNYIPWVVGRDPYRSVIFATYSDDFAEDTGRACRNAMKSSMYGQVFPECKLRPGSSSSSRIETEAGGVMAFVGAGGAITGRGADFLIIDDPIKGREEADSRLEREKLWSWFNDVALTRMMNDMSIVIIIMTRWHEDDIVGRIIDPTNENYNEEEARKYKILALPALAEEDDPIGRKPGESLWPDRFSEEYLLQRKAANARGFSALYQGRPSPEDGDFFKKEYFSEYTLGQLPMNLRIYCTSDHAVTTEQYSDFNVLLPFGVDEQNHIWILPTIFWKKATSDVVVANMINMMRIHNPIFWWAENGHISKSVGPFLRQQMLEEKVYCSIVEVTPAKNKQQRAQSIKAKMSMGMVHWPKYMPWYRDARDQLLKFPAGAKDDFVDALSLIGIGLGIQAPASKSNKKPDIQPKEGTIGWILEQSKWNDRQLALSQRDGF